MAFIFQPRVHNRDGSVATPDIAVERVLVVDPAANKPQFTPIPLDRLTTGTEVQQIGGAAHGSAAILLVASSGGMLIGIGSNHIDASAPANFTHQICAKPICREVWRYRDVADRWQDLRLRAWSGNARTEILSTKLGAMMDPQKIVDRLGDGTTLAHGTAVLMSGFAASGDDAGARRFEIELDDSGAERQLRMVYFISVLSLDVP